MNLYVLKFSDGYGKYESILCHVHEYGDKEEVCLQVEQQAMKRNLECF